MEIRQLACFVAVAEELSFRRAAERLHISQPHVTRVIQALEEDIGAQLFSRTRRSILLTAAGQRLLGDARDIVARAQSARLEAQRAAAGEVGSLALGYVSSAGAVLMPALVQAFRAEYPRVVLSLSAMTSNEQLHALRANAIQIGLLRALQAEPGLVLRAVYSEGLFAVVPERHHYADRAAVRLQELQDEPLILYPRAEGPAIHDRIVEHCRSAGFEPTIVQECGPNQGMTGLVAAGIGIALTIGTALSLAGYGVRVVEIADAIPPWPLYLAWLPEIQSATASAFLGVAEKVPVPTN